MKLTNIFLLILIIQIFLLVKSQDYYSVLGVKRDATKQEIKKSFISLSKKYHPDKTTSKSKSNSDEKYAEIINAYEVLKDPKKKQEYDDSLKYGTNFNNNHNYNNQKEYYYTYSQNGKFYKYSYNNDYQEKSHYYKTRNRNNYNEFQNLSDLFAYLGKNLYMFNSEYYDIVEMVLDILFIFLTIFITIVSIFTSFIIRLLS